MPIEPEDTAERLKPHRIGKATHQSWDPLVDQDRQRHLTGEQRHPLEQPAWRASAVQRKVGSSGWHRLSLERLERGPTSKNERPAGECRPLKTDSSCR